MNCKFVVVSFLIGFIVILGYFMWQNRDNFEAETLQKFSKACSDPREALKKWVSDGQNKHSFSLGILTADVVQPASSVFSAFDPTLPPIIIIGDCNQEIRFLNGKVTQPVKERARDTKDGDVLWIPASAIMKLSLCAAQEIYSIFKKGISQITPGAVNTLWNTIDNSQSDPECDGWFSQIATHETFQTLFDDNVDITSFVSGPMGSLDSLIDYGVLTTKKGVHSRYSNLIAKLEARGYQRNKNLFGAPFDFRRILEKTECKDWVAAFTRFLDENSKNFGKKFVVVGFAVGALLATSVFRNNEYLRSFVSTFISVATPYGGIPFTTKTLISGTALDYTSTEQYLFGAICRTWASSYLTTPIEACFDFYKYGPLHATDDKDYVLAHFDMEHMNTNMYHFDDFTKYMCKISDQSRLYGIIFGGDRKQNYADQNTHFNHNQSEFCGVKTLNIIPCCAKFDKSGALLDEKMIPNGAEMAYLYVGDPSDYSACDSHKYIKDTIHKTNPVIFYESAIYSTCKGLQKDTLKTLFFPYQYSSENFAKVTHFNARGDAFVPYCSYFYGFRNWIRDEKLKHNIDYQYVNVPNCDMYSIVDSDRLVQLIINNSDLKSQDSLNID